MNDTTYICKRCLADGLEPNRFNTKDQYDLHLAGHIESPASVTPAPPAGPERTSGGSPDPAAPPAGEAPRPDPPAGDLRPDPPAGDPRPDPPAGDPRPARAPADPPNPDPPAGDPRPARAPADPPNPAPLASDAYGSGGAILARLGALEERLEGLAAQETPPAEIIHAVMERLTPRLEELEERTSVEPRRRDTASEVDEDVAAQLRKQIDADREHTRQLFRDLEADVLGTSRNAAERSRILAAAYFVAQWGKETERDPAIKAALDLVDAIIEADVDRRKPVDES